MVKNGRRSYLWHVVKVSHEFQSYLIPELNLEPHELGIKVKVTTPWSLYGYEFKESSGLCVVGLVVGGSFAML